MSDVKVSVLCTTYDQEDTVVRMLDSILSQRTDFSVEILVHDDASTDGTVSVLRDYERRHVNTIRLFLEERNRFGDPTIAGYFTSILAPEAKGDYVAFCEGDDYWCDPHKLQRQYDYMESHPACSECVHQALRIDSSSGQTFDLIGMGSEEQDVTVAQLIRGWNVPTASRFVRKRLLEHYAANWVFDKPAGDFPLAVYLGSRGYTHHDPMVASVYEYQRPGSYSSRTLSENGIVENARRWLVMLQAIDVRTDRLYHEPLMDYAVHYANIMAERGRAREALTGLGTEALSRLGYDESGNRCEEAPKRRSLVRRAAGKARRWLHGR